MSESNTDRVLGDIQGTQRQILTEIERFREDFREHKIDDQEHFSALNDKLQVQASSVRTALVEQARTVQEALTARAEKEDDRAGKQDEKLAAIKEDADRAKGAGWVILGLLGALATFVGGAVIAALSGWLQFRP